MENFNKNKFRILMEVNKNNHPIKAKINVMK